jgi:hypothetical protein
MLQLREVLDAEFASILPMVEAWCENQKKTPDCSAAGLILDVRRFVIEDWKESGLVWMGAWEDGELIGVVGHRILFDYLEGAVMWIEPPRRCCGHLQELFDALLQVAMREGKVGIQFQSKVWGKAPTALGFVEVGAEMDGGDVVRMWRRLCGQVGAEMDGKGKGG